MSKRHEDKEFPFTDRDFKYLSKLAYEQTGIVLAEKKKTWSILGFLEG